MESIQEKMYDFEVNKRNNLLFYNIREEKRETPSDLNTKASDMMKKGHFLNSTIIPDQKCFEREFQTEERHCDQWRIPDVLRP